MEYFSKVKNASLKAAQQGYNLIHTVTAVAQDMAANPTFQSKRPVDDFLLRFQTVCQTLDNLAKLDNASSAEAERVLNDSKVRDHVKAMLRHLQVEDEQWVATHIIQNSGEDEIRDHPCLEVFLQSHVMEELCGRAKRDKPRGCLPFVLAIATSVLRVVRYPLLPHQTVHTSLCQLLVNASSISSKYSAIAKGKSQSTAEIVAYVKKIDMNLVALISALWKRITENPDLLAFFRFIDTRDNAKVRQHLYAITCLIPLMGKPRVGLAAKEALLLAVSMHDSRVDEFIIQETNLAKNIISELCKKFEACVASTANADMMVPMSSGSLRAGGADYSSLHPLVATRAQSSKPIAVDSFIRVLRFCAAFVAAASDGVVNGGTSLRESVCLLYVQNFLNDCMKSHLLENGEQQVLAAQSLCTYILQEVSSPGSAKQNDSVAGVASRSASSSMQSLRPLTTHLVCSDPAFLLAFLPRVGSVSRAVSISTMQLLMALLDACSLEEAKHLVFANSTADQDIAVVNSYDPAAMIHQALERGIVVCEENKWVRNITADEFIETYKTASLSRILRMMTGNRSAIQFSSAESDESIDRNSVPGSLFDLTVRKLRAFLTLKYDEQVAVTGLVEKCVTVLAVLVVQSGIGPLTYRYISKVSEVSGCICDLVEQLTAHLNRIPEFEVKLEMVRSVLVHPQNADLRVRRVLDSENQQTIRILETGVLIQELFCEVEGGLSAMNQLRNMLHVEEEENMNPDACSPSAMQRRDSGSINSGESFSEDGDDDDSDYGEFRMLEIGTLGEPTSLVNEDSFLSACAGLEESLDVILRESNCPDESAQYENTC